MAELADGMVHNVDSRIFGPPYTSMLGSRARCQEYSDEKRLGKRIISVAVSAWVTKQAPKHEGNHGKVCGGITCCSSTDQRSEDEFASNLAYTNTNKHIFPSRDHQLVSLQIQKRLNLMERLINDHMVLQGTLCPLLSRFSL